MPSLSDGKLGFLPARRIDAEPGEDNDVQRRKGIGAKLGDGRFAPVWQGEGGIDIGGQQAELF